MFKASTVYAAYGKKQPRAAGPNGSNAATRVQGTTIIEATNSSSLPGNLASTAADGSQVQQASTTGVRQQKEQHALRSTTSSSSCTGTANAASLSTAFASTAGATISSNAGKAGNLAGTAAAAPGFSLEPRTWIQQAADVTDGLLDASKYKSLAVYAEVRLAEALDKAAQACPNSIAGAAPEDCDDGPLPNPLATAVCCQLLGELADMCGPFQPTLLKLREALLPSIYSCCSGPSLGTNRPLQFDMLPWFALAGRLRRQNNQLLEQQAAFSQELTQHQEHMAQVEQQMQNLQSALEAGTASAAVLQATNATLVAERTAAVAEAAAASEEVKKLTEEVARLSAELDTVQEQLSTVKEEYESEQEQWKAQLDTYLLKLNVEAHERTAAVAVAAVQQQELEQKLWEVERKLEEAELQLQQQNGGQDRQQLTPRPSDWGPDQQLADACKSTAETVRQMQQQHASQLADLQRQLQLLEALAQPDPCPKPWQLNLRAEASKYFLTELDTDPTAQGSGDARAGFSPGPPKPKLFAAGLGLGSEVPRFLRWDEPVEVHDVGLQDLEQQVCQLWQAQKAYEAAHGQCCLQTFLYEHFRAQAVCAAAAADSAQATAARTPAAAATAAASPDVVLSQLGAAISTKQPAAQPAEASSGSAQPALTPAPPAAAAAGAADSVGAPSSSMCGSRSGSGAGSSSGASVQQALTLPGPAADCPGQPTTAVTASAAEAGYHLYYACCTHRHDSVAVELLWLVLTGQLPEAMVDEQRLQLQAVASVLQELHARAANAGTAESAGTAAPAAAAGSVGEPESALEVGEALGQSDGSSRSVSAASVPTGVPWTCIMSTMQALFPARSQHHQQELTSWLAAACGVPVASSSNGGSSGASKPEAQVTATTLAALICALQQELSCRFGSSSVTTTSSGSGGVSAGSEAAATVVAARSVHTAAVRQLTEGLLRQQLMLALQHSQEVGQQVQQLLQAAAAGNPAEGAGVSGAAGGAGVLPAAGNPVWQQVVQYLHGQGLQASSSHSTAGDGSGAETLSRVLSCVHAAKNAADGSHALAGACSVVGMLQRSSFFVSPACRADPLKVVMACTQLNG